MKDSSRLRHSVMDRILAIAQLLRLSNVFTAMADVWMGYILVMYRLEPIEILLGLTLCSALLYTAGMVLNDVVDAEVDARERPERPIPSGKISRCWANILGWNLLIAGLLVSFVMSLLGNSAAPGIIAWGLCVLIVSYNAWFKNTWLGPFALAACRAGNVMLGMSPLIIQLDTFDFIFLDIPFAPALGIGCYVCGFSFFAREEHAPKQRSLLGVGLFFVVCGFVILATAPWWEFAASLLAVPTWQWFVLWGALGGLVLRKFVAALFQPTSRKVQQAVGYAILMLIPIDAAFCWGYADWEWAAMVLALLLPARVFSRWLRVT